MSQFPGIRPELAREGGEAGHALFGRIRALPYPTLAAVNGAAVGGGVEIALHCDFRTISSGVRHFACPEVFLGLIPGWGGTQLVPRLVGAETAVKFVVENPLRQNRMLTGSQAFEAGFADALLEPSSSSTSRSHSCSRRSSPAEHRASRRICPTPRKWCAGRARAWTTPSTEPRRRRTGPST